MSYEERATILFCIICIPVVVGLIYILNSNSCSSKWEGSGYNHSYSLMAGCRIQKDGKWIPTENLREM